MNYFIFVFCFTIGILLILFLFLLYFFHQDTLPVTVHLRTGLIHTVFGILLSICCVVKHKNRSIERLQSKRQYKNESDYLFKHAAKIG